jgi:hypothetical protein
MYGDFECLDVKGGMFSIDFLHRIADLDQSIEGIDPETFDEADKSSLDSLIGATWGMVGHLWRTLGNKAIESGEGSKTMAWISRFLDSLGIKLGTKQYQTPEDRPNISRHAHGSLFHVVPTGAELDERGELKGTKRISPHALIQGQLNSSNELTWGLLSNGLKLRLLRSSNRPSVIEVLDFDLLKMFEENHYGDFKLLFILLHRSRWPEDATKHDQCWLETWYKQSNKEGVSALEDLQKCVIRAAECLGTGVIRLRAGNMQLREFLKNDVEAKDILQRELMRLVYRMIFIFVTEDRDLLLKRPTDDCGEEERLAINEARQRYETGYSTARRRSVVLKTKQDDHMDMYDELKIIMQSLFRGHERLAIPGLGSFLFSPEATPILDECNITNRDYLHALYSLCYFKRENTNHRVHWKSLREDELGSVYESLLELRAVVDLERGLFKLKQAEGNERKSSGSFYTPPDLVQHLISTTIYPMITDAIAKADKNTQEESDIVENRIAEILKITVCDPACGSGHFLIAALNEIAVALARIESGEDNPGPSIIMKWKRVVASNCIYGVDLNPLAVELCKVAIWMDTVDGEQPLSFLDAHIKHGNSLLGQRIENAGLIPDDALPKSWKDARKENRAKNRDLRRSCAQDLTAEKQELLVRRNRLSKPGSGQRTLFSSDEIAGPSPEEQIIEIETRLSEIDEIIQEIDKKMDVDTSDSWTGINIKQAIIEIAKEQAELKAMSEEDFEALETKALRAGALQSDARYLWAKELLDATISPWWWPDPEFERNESGELVTDGKNPIMLNVPTVPLMTQDIKEYATWLAMEHGIEDSVIEDGKVITMANRHRWEFIREQTAEISERQNFFHWELEFAEVFFEE